MITNQQRLQVLDQMGIAAWQYSKRDVTHVPCYGYQLFAKDGQWSGTVLADVGGDVASEQTLLNAIARALGCTAEGQLYAHQPDVAAWVARAPVVILLGADVLAAYSSLDAVNCCSLADMLANPLLKAPVWKVLSEVFIGA